MNSFSRFSEKELSKQEDFYSLLSDEDITEEEETCTRCLGYI